MAETEYDYGKAYEHIRELRRKVILQKGGEAMEGLTYIEIPKEKTKVAKSVNKQKTSQEQEKN